MNQLLGGRIKALRSVRHLTQEQVAEQVGISRQKYARIENGTNPITLEILSQIAGILDVTVGDITSVLDESPSVAYRMGEGNAPSGMILEMLDLFYANKHLYERLRNHSDER